MKYAIRIPNSKTRNNRLPATGYQLPTANSPLPTSGFTLIELLIVIVIIVILAAIGVGVGYKFSKAADIEQTKTNLTLIMNALKDYYDQTGAYPAQADDTPGDEDYRIRVPRMDSSGNVLPSFDRFANKLREVGDKVFAKETFECDPSPSSNPHDALFNLVDPEGRPILYVRYGGIGGTPLLVAPGEDGKTRFDDGPAADQKQWGKDDIRSDK